MMMNKFLNLILLFFFLLFHINCSENSAGGSSSSENAKVLTAVITDTLGKPLEGLDISLFEISETVPFLTIQTDINGRLEVAVPENKEFTLIGDDKNCFSAFKIYQSFWEDTLFDTIQMQKNGYINITFDSEISVTNGTIKILGTDHIFPLSSAINNGDGSWSIALPNLPAADLPPLVISHDSTEQELAPSLTVFSAESSSVVIKESSAMHQWDIPIAVSVKKVIADYFGGLDSIKVKINNQLDSASKIINSLADLSGEFNFKADSFTTFTGSAITEGNKPLGNAYHRLVYTDTSLDRSAKRELVDSRLQYLWLSSLSYDFFKEWDLTLMIHLLTEGRGAIPLQYLNVDSGSVPISHNGYKSISSVMNKYNYSDYMTDYTKNILLNNRAINGNERAILSESIADTIILLDSTFSFTTLSIFGSALSASTLDTMAIMIVEGEFQSTHNEYKIPKSVFLSNGNVKYGTLMLLSDMNQSRWLTIREVSEAWFQGNKNKYLITF